MRPAFPDFLRRLFLGQAEVLHEPLISQAFFNGIQVLALQILDKGDFSRFIRRILADDGRHRFQAAALRCPQPPFAGNQFIPARSCLLDDDGLDKPMLTDGIRQSGQPLFIKGLPRLMGIGDNTFYGDFCRGAPFSRGLVDCHHVHLISIKIIFKVYIIVYRLSTI